MKVLFDTNVLIDFLLDRAPFADAATDLLSRADRGQIKGLVCATSMTTIFYLVQKTLGKSEAHGHIATLLSILDVAPVNRTTLERAAGSAATDYEDAVVVEAARQANATCIVTRDERDFANSPIPAHSPGALIGLLGQLSSD